jgi:mRNA turnover protein 4
MPRTKRSKLVSLTRTSRKTKEDKSSLIDSLRAASDEFAYVWLFSIGNMRNNYLKEVRNLWAGSRIFFGKNRVMAKALGESTEHELKKGLAGISQVSRDNGKGCQSCRSAASGDSGSID